MSADKQRISLACQALTNGRDWPDDLVCILCDLQLTVTTILLGCCDKNPSAANTMFKNVLAPEIEEQLEKWKEALSK